jgi:UPF0716 protein FxsA
MPWLFILFVVVPAVELYLLIQLGQLIGAAQTFGIILATGFLGSYMAKTQGLAVWNKLNAKMAAGQMPGKELTDGAIILVSGTLLITPGILTDVVGLLGLIPLTRSLLRRAAQSILKRRTGLHMGFSTFGASQPNMGFGQSGPFSPPEAKQGSASESSRGTTDAGPVIELSGKAKARPSREDS